MSHHNFTYGAELEFYIFSDTGEIVADLNSGRFPQKPYTIKPQFFRAVDEYIKELHLYGYDFKKESGPGQYEIQTEVYTDKSALIKKLNHFRYLADRIASKYNLAPSFHPKPLEGYPGSGLHVHLSSHNFDPNGISYNQGVVTIRREPDNNSLLWAIGGLLERMKQDMRIFIPFDDSADRFVPYMNAPTKICWGKNNRSVAVRIPDSKPKRLEHRVAGADVNIDETINAIDAAAAYGIDNKINPGEPIWGNAWDIMYERESILDCLAKAPRKEQVIPA